MHYTNMNPCPGRVQASDQTGCDPYLEINLSYPTRPGTADRKYFLRKGMLHDELKLLYLSPWDEYLLETPHWRVQLVSVLVAAGWQHGVLEVAHPTKLVVAVYWQVLYNWLSVKCCITGCRSSVV